jgi:hypothetical protein
VSPRVEIFGVTHPDEGVNNDDQGSDGHLVDAPSSVFKPHVKVTPLGRGVVNIIVRAEVEPLLEFGAAYPVEPDRIPENALDRLNQENSQEDAKAFVHISAIFRGSKLFFEMRIAPELALDSFPGVWIVVRL